MEEKSGGKDKKWKLWRSSYGDLVSSAWKGFKENQYHRSLTYSDGSDSPSLAYGSDPAFTATIATVVRAHPKDFKVVRKEWACYSDSNSVSWISYNLGLCYFHNLISSIELLLYFVCCTLGPHHHFKLILMVMVYKSICKYADSWGFCLG